MKHFLLHQKLHIRFLSLAAIAASLFLVTWAVSYLLLPEGILRGRTGAQFLAGGEAADTFLAEWMLIVSINLMVGIIFVICPNLLRSRGYPVGYLTPLTWAILYAIYLGTNSFTFPLPGGKMAPSLAVLGRSGPYEISAYILAAVATHSLPRYELEGRWFRERLRSIPPADRRSLTGDQWIGVGMAIILLLIANGWEAHQIVSQYAATSAVQCIPSTIAQEETPANHSTGYVRGLHPSPSQGAQHGPPAGGRKAGELYDRDPWRARVDPSPVGLVGLNWSDLHRTCYVAMERSEFVHRSGASIS
jgi:hypothetical protein